MLLEFSFKNVASFKDEAILDMTATKITEFNERVVNVSNEHVLPTAAIFGANASGKSNVYKAFEFMNYYVSNSTYYSGKDDKYLEDLCFPFLFSKESKKDDSKFEAFFTIPNDNKEKTYDYGFILGEKGIIEEWLYAKAKTSKEYKKIFSRDIKGTDMPGIDKTKRDNILVSLDKNVLVISLGSLLKVEICSLVFNWFSMNQFVDYGDAVNNFINSKLLPKDFVDSKKVQNDIVKYFNSFDKGIKGFNVQEVMSNDNSKEKRYRINTKHRMIDSDEYAEIPLDLESSGTLKMFNLYQFLQDALDNGGVLFVDELSGRLHTLLIRNILLLFLNPELNKNHAQLIFTSHDTFTLSNELLRRDEIWFTDKDDNGLSRLYSLADFIDDDGSKIRKDESYYKNYLLGKYGAIPSLENIKL